jgi:hypothetical protein
MKPKTIGILGLSMLAVLWGCGADGSGASAEVMSKSESGRTVLTRDLSSGEMELVSFDSAAAPQTRDIIRTGWIKMHVDDVDGAARQIRQMAQAAGGFDEESTIRQSRTAAASAELILRVPSGDFVSILDEIEKMGWRESRNSEGEDVTDQLVDLDARIRAAKSEETAYIDIMSSAKQIAEVLKVQGEISKVRTRIEQMEARQLSMKRKASLSTIHVTLTQNDVVPTSSNPSWAKQSLAGSVSTLQGFGRAAGSTGIFLAVTSPIWAIPAFVIWWIIGRRRRNEQAQPTG